MTPGQKSGEYKVMANREQRSVRIAQREQRMTSLSAHNSDAVNSFDSSFQSPRPNFFHTRPFRGRRLLDETDRHDLSTPRAEGAGGVPRESVRVLHARLRHEHVRFNF